MFSYSNSFLQALSDPESQSTPSSYSTPKVQTMMKVSINKSNKDGKPQKEFLSKMLDNTKPTRLGKPSSEFRNCNVNSILQTLKRFDQKYCQKPVKEKEVIPLRNDIFLPIFHGNSKFSSSDINSGVKRTGKNCGFSSY
jgi:hypothetical protein